MKPAMAAVTAVLWCVAQALDCGLLAAGVTVLALAGAALTAGDRRADPRSLRTAVVAVMAVAGAGLGALLVVTDVDLLGRLIVVAVLAPAVPLIYALTFPREGGR